MKTKLLMLALIAIGIANADNNETVVNSLGNLGTNHIITNSPAIGGATAPVASPTGTLNSSLSDNDGYLSAYGVSAQVGTLGLGINLTRALYSDYLNIRLQANYLQYNNSISVAGVSNDYNLNMNTYGLLLDYMPLGGIFRLTGGVYYDSRNLEASSEQVNIGNALTASGNAGVKFDQFAPYLGVGIGSQAASSKDKKGLILAGDFGVLFQNPQAYTNLSCTSTTPGACVEVNNQINTFRNDLQNGLNTFAKFYPVLSFSVGYRF